MKKDALLIHTARAGLIEKGALLSVLEFWRFGFAAIDDIQNFLSLSNLFDFLYCLVLAI